MLRLTWRLVAQREAVVRYCQGCGRATEFRNSFKVRRNANGKTIHQFEIYKCERDHTWNRKVAATDGSLAVEDGPGTQVSRLLLKDLQQAGGAEIHLERVSGKWRLDKVLADQMPEASRALVRSWIDEGKVLVNGAREPGKRQLQSGDVIILRSLER